ncbi:sulfotransferase [Marinilabiliaceae bacterium JC017]|nr:sulfotransferase [Marinilabiliaceae bacterium JC017]
MSKFDFNSLPVNTLFGSRWSNFKQIAKGREIDANYKNKYRLTKSLCGLLSMTHPIEDLKYFKRVDALPIEEDPVFILGHWRSGTTFVHNIFAQDQHFGYNTTYQTVFSNAMVWGQPFFKSVMNKIMPDKRPTDNMELMVDQPQEEEFALCNIMPYSFYNFWFFPKDTLEYCEKYLLFNDISKEELAVFKREFTRLIKTALYNTGGKQFLSKNPPHTGRVKELVKMFPNAKFIYLMRNPYTVFESTRSFFTKTIQPLKFQDFSNEEIEANILEVYRRLYHKYEQDKVFIPSDNLFEVRFEDYEADAFGKTREIYEKLSLSDFTKASEKIKDYVDKKRQHVKTRYEYAPETIQKVNDNWGFALDQWKYDRL